MTTLQSRFHLLPFELLQQQANKKCQQSTRSIIMACKRLTNGRKLAIVQDLNHRQAEGIFESFFCLSGNIFSRKTEPFSVEFDSIEFTSVVVFGFIEI